MVPRYPDSGSQDELDLDIRILSDNLTIRALVFAFLHQTYFIHEKIAFASLEHCP